MSIVFQYEILHLIYLHLLSIHSFFNSLMDVYYMAETVLAAWQIAPSKTMSLLSRSLHSRGKRQ